MTRASRWRHSPAASRSLNETAGGWAVVAIPASSADRPRVRARPGRSRSDRPRRGPSSRQAKGWRSGSRSRRRAPAGRWRTGPASGSGRSDGGMSRSGRRPGAGMRQSPPIASQSWVWTSELTLASEFLAIVRATFRAVAEVRATPIRSRCRGSGVAICSPAVRHRGGGPSGEEGFAAGRHVGDQPGLLFDLGPQGGSRGRGDAGFVVVSVDGRGGAAVRAAPGRSRSARVAVRRRVGLAAGAHEQDFVEVALGERPLAGGDLRRSRPGRERAPSLRASAPD